MADATTVPHDAAAPVDDLAGAPADATVPNDAADTTDALDAVGATDDADTTDAAGSLDIASPDLTPTAPDLPLTGTCADVAIVATAQQVALVESNTSCADEFVAALKAAPSQHLDALFLLVQSSIASDAVWSVLYDEVRLGRFRFDATVVEQLFAGLPPAIALCPASNQRCNDWTTYILTPGQKGAFYLCPSSMTGQLEPALLAHLSYGDYACTEQVAAALAPIATTDTITALLSRVGNETRGWARRNAARVLLRFGDRPAPDSARTLVRTTRATDISAAMALRLTADTDSDLLADAIYLLDAVYYPYFAMQPALEALTSNTARTSDTRFRAIAALTRLLYAKSGLLPQADFDFLWAQLHSDDVYVRAQAAYGCERVRDNQITTPQRTQMVDELNAVWGTETELQVRVYIARALDRFAGNTTLQTQLKNDYEATHLPNTATGDGVTVRSGLPAGELPAFVSLLEQERAAFFDMLGAPFATAVAGDTNPAMVLVVFDTMAHYREYMASFIGYGAYAGGLYLENSGTLYTYQRTPAESTYTVEELIQHEFGHYLNGRYVYPGTFTSSGYHTEPKAWHDEGFAEVLGGLTFPTSTTYELPLRALQVQRLCAAPFRNLGDLITQREGYDQSGTFDYDNGWSFQYFLYTQRKASSLAIFSAYRDTTYTVASFASIAGVASVTALETEWHDAMQAWCDVVPLSLHRTTASRSPLSSASSPIHPCADVVRLP